MMGGDSFRVDNLPRAKECVLEGADRGAGLDLNIMELDG